MFSLLCSGIWDLNLKYLWNIKMFICVCDNIWSMIHSYCMKMLNYLTISDNCIFNACLCEVFTFTSFVNFVWYPGFFVYQGYTKVTLLQCSHQWQSCQVWRLVQAVQSGQSLWCLVPGPLWLIHPICIGRQKATTGNSTTVCFLLGVGSWPSALISRFSVVVSFV